MSKPNAAGRRSDSNWLTVSVDANEIKAARKLAQAAEATQIQHLFDTLDYSPYIDLDTADLMERHRQKVVERLMTVLEEQPGTDEAVGAALLLTRLQHEAGRNQLVLLLQSGTVEQRRRILNDIAMVHGDDQLKSHREFLFSDPDMPLHLAQQLDDAEPEVVKAAIHSCGYLNVPNCHDRFLKLLEGADAPLRGRILHWLSRGELTDELLEIVLQPSIAFKPNDHWGSSFFEAFLKSCSTAAKARAKQHLRKVIEDWRDDGRKGYDGARLGLLATLATNATDEDLPWIRELASREQGHYAVEPLTAWIRLDPIGGRSILFKWLSSKKRRRAAIDAARHAYRKSEDDEVIHQLAIVIQRCNEGELSAICSALNSIGGATAHQLIESVAGQLDPVEIAHFRQCVDCSSLSDIESAIRSAGLLSNAELDSALSCLRNQNNEVFPPSLFNILCLAKRVTIFDVETATLPCRHDQLVTRFSEASRGKFFPEAIHEQWHQKNTNDFEADYTLQFIFREKLYRGIIRNFGDWYDVDRVVTMINTALRDVQLSERFVGLVPNGQIASFVFADPAALVPVAKRFHMALSEKPWRSET